MLIVAALLILGLAVLAGGVSRGELLGVLLGCFVLFDAVTLYVVFGFGPQFSQLFLFGH